MLGALGDGLGLAVEVAVVADAALVVHVGVEAGIALAELLEDAHVLFHHFDIAVEVVDVDV